MEQENNLNFKYYNYNQDLFKETISKQPNIYVFANYNDLKEALKCYQPEPLSQQSQFFSLKEFKERLFSSDQILLKEEKLPLLLYSVLTSEEKKELRLDNYQDIYQFSAQFFGYFKLLQDYQLSEIKGLADWQQHRVNRLLSIKKRYQLQLKQLGYVDQLVLKDNNNLNLQFLKEFKQINLFNIVDFTPYFKKILQQMSSEFEINLHLQLKKEDFNEKKLEIESLTLPEKRTIIEIRKANSKLKSLAAFLEENENSKAELQLIDAGSDIDSAEILSDQLNINSYRSLSETEVYQLLNSIYQLYQKGKKSSHILIELKELYNLSTQSLFKQWLKIKAEDLQKIKELLRNDYYYLNYDLIKSELSVLKPLYKLLENLRKIKNISELIELVTEVSDFALEAEAKETAEKFNDSLLELKSIEEMGVVKSWQDYYSDRGAGLLSLLLNHLKFKSISLAVNDEAAEFFSLENAPQIKREKLLLNNLTQENFVHKNDGLYFLTEKQLKNNGLKLNHKKQLLKKYKFLRHILTAEKSIIFTVENEDENISPAVILEELILEYDLDYNQCKLNMLNEKEILNNLFNYQTEVELEVNHKADFNKNLKIEADDFGSSFNFSYYKYKYLKDCYHRFYLEELARLDTTLEIKPSLSLRALGILTHEIFGELIIYARDQKIDPAEISAENRKNIIKKNIKANKLKIDREYLNYYQKVIFNSLENSFIHFTELLQKYLPDDYQNILIEWPEWDYQRQKYFSNQQIDFYLSGRIDLLLLSQSEYFIIDFKTGSGDHKQLDFYSLMLRQNYKKKLPSESRKAIYNVFEQAFEHSYNKVEKEDSLGQELQELIKLLLAAGEYDRIYKSRCQRCPYKDICRVEVLNNEEGN
ncbi:PD-(D/E)XK nuclease family protein [Halanaerobium congolense]|uniref:PD-(D/E)XK nuclease family protein n=1 Tax=Halanaerobium congolense TaxID=54121 RepID=UPI00087FB57D|nr:PD-(D/E)XK nuclease family protein [Halanaerobium congolense]SDH56237.1 PD-(D/E)XK nuclease superfamily protein [Halanaerobium congolense]